MTAYYAPYTYFRSVADPATIHGISTPKRFLQRAWHKGDPSVPPYNTDINGYCPQGIAVCDLPVREAGIFWAKERVNGVEREDSVAINCFSGDSLLDFVASRKRFLDAVDSARVGDATPTNRKEFVFAIVRDPGPPSHLSVLWIKSPGADQCTSPWDAGDLNPVYGYGQVVAIVHVHPDYPNEIITCPAKPGEQLTALPGLSIPDYAAMKETNKFFHDNFTWDPVPWYVIDKQNVYRLKPGQRLNQSTAPGNVFPWDRGRCKWARPTPTQVPVSF